MAYSEKELTIVRDLAKQYMEVTMSDKHIRMRERFKATNDLKIVRPPLIMEEIPWHEMNLEKHIHCLCENNELRGIEHHLRFLLWREKTFRCDHHMDPFWSVYKAFSNTGNGFDWAVKEDIITVDNANDIVSHHYHDILEEEENLEKMYHDPVVTPYPETDAANLARMNEIFNGAMPVVPRGHALWHSPWDAMSRLRGVEPALIDIYDRPEYMHKIMQYFTRARSIEMDQMEKHGLYDSNCTVIHCTPGAFTHTTKYDPCFGTCKDTWFRTMAQMFSTVSPEIHYEFDMLYSAPLANRCAFTYRRMMKAMKTSNAADNLLQREFEEHGPRKVLLTDITYILYNSAKCYLSTILDAYTKQVLAYVISESLEVDFVLETVNQLVEKHGISLDAETLIHSDQGCHYTSLKFIQLVNDSGLRQSMSRRGNCWDNAPQESFFGHMKDEIDLSSCSSFADVCSIIDDWIDYYNNERYQWDLAKLSPNEFYEYCITGIYPLPVYQTDSE